MFSNKKSSHAPDNRIMDTLIGEHCTLSGDIISKNSIKIDGSIQGNIESEVCIVGEKAWIKGDINCTDLIVFGRVDGNIKTNTLNLKYTAKIHGNINTKNLEIEPGAIYQGNVQMQDEGIPVLEYTIEKKISAEIEKLS